MLQHATQFSFDRLKFIIPSAIMIALAFIDRSFWFRLFVISLIFLACFHGVKSHQSDMARYSDWSHHHQANVALVERLKEQVDFYCATFASNLGVRGYANLLIGRSIYEYKTPDQAYSLNVERGGCASVFLEGRWVFPDLQSYSKAIVSWPDGRRSILSEGEVVYENDGFLPVVNLDIFFLTDESWINGIARRWAGFFTHNTEVNRANFKVGNTVIFSNEEKRTIISVVENGPYLNIWVDGEILNPEDVGLPSQFEVRQ